MNGPAYTDDQYLINTGASPTFGRSPADKIESSAPGTTAADVCSGSNCQNANFEGTPRLQRQADSDASDNSELLTDAQNYGNVFSGTTTISLNGTNATVTSVHYLRHHDVRRTTTTGNLVNQPIIYVNNASGCTPTAYTPFGVTYPTNSSGHYYGLRRRRVRLGQLHHAGDDRRRQQRDHRRQPDHHRPTATATRPAAPPSVWSRTSSCA